MTTTQMPFYYICGHERTLGQSTPAQLTEMVPLSPPPSKGLKRVSHSKGLEKDVESWSHSKYREGR